MKSRGMIDVFSLKLIMAALMLLDHMYYYLFPRELLWAHYLSRVVAPVFAFLMTRSMLYTRNRRRYLSRLLLAGLLMQAGNFLLFAATGTRISNNIFLSLAAGAFLIVCVENILEGRNRILNAVLAAMLFCLSFSLEGQFLVPAMALIFYFFRRNEPLMYTLYLALSTLLFLPLFLVTGQMQPQFYMVVAVVPLLLYNEQRGYNGAFAKYFFYIFYPLHIWILAIINFFCFRY